MARKKTQRFTFTREEEIFALKFGHENVRSKKSRNVDDGTTRGVTMDFGKVWEDPSRHDFPGIDTVVKKNFPGYTRTKGKSAFNKMTKIFGESGFM